LLIRVERGGSDRHKIVYSENLANEQRSKYFLGRICFGSRLLLLADGSVAIIRGRHV